MVSMTVAQWLALVDYLGNVTFDDRDTLELENVEDDRVRAQVRAAVGGYLVDEVEVGMDGEA